MTLSNVGAATIDKKLVTARKAKTLNPNAAEFIPSALRSSSGSTSNADVPTSLGASATATETLGKKVLDRSGSSISNNSDEGAHQYWCHQLPDEITPDFDITGKTSLRELTASIFLPCTCMIAMKYPGFLLLRAVVLY